MLKAFQKYIAKHQLISNGDAILIGVSGGRDSVVLCELFFQAKIAFAMAHCNFNLRGDESDQDEEFVKNLAEKYRVKLHKKSCDTKAYALENGISIQMAARDLRFSWFKELIEKNEYTSYATAHHQDDAIETYLINQIRGTGIAGLHGILPKIGQLIHPLLFASRKDIDIFVKQNHLSFREDGSNSSTKYMRNKIRHQLIPLLAEINPQINQVFLDNMQRIASAEEIYQLKIKECRKEFSHQMNGQVRIRIQEFMQQDFAPTLLFELIKEYGFNYTQAKQVLGTDEESISGSLYFSGSHRMLRDRHYLIIEENKIAEVEQFEISEETLSISSPIQVLIEKSNKLKIIPDSNIAQLDFTKLVFPLQLRHWKKGDFFYPLGMKGRKKLLSDFFIDQKLSLFEKENVWLLCSNKQIVWIVSYRLDDRFKITETTKEVYQLTYLPKPVQ